MTSATVTVPGLTWTWDELDPRGLGDEAEWIHPGLAALPGGGVRAFDQTTAELVDLDPDGAVTRRLETGILCGHGLAVDARDRTWVADPGMRARLRGTEVERTTQHGLVSVVEAGGGARTLSTPSHPLYVEKPYRPTSVAIERPGDPETPVWIADGYGGSLVHRFDASGEQTLTLDGAPGVGRFDCPHAVEIDTRGDQPVLLVADRGNAVIHRFDLDGRHISTVGPAGFTSPSAFAVAGDVLLVAELRGRVAVLDPDDGLMGHIGDGSAHFSEAGWPNRQEGEATLPRRPFDAGRFVAPHGITVLGDGVVIVAEWRIGGRLVRLSPAA